MLTNADAVSQVQTYMRVRIGMLGKDDRFEVRFIVY